MDLSEKTPQPQGKFPPLSMLPARAPKHRARATVKTTLAEHRAARERGQWFLAGRDYPTSAGRHAAEVTA